MKENLPLEWCPLRQRPALRRLDDLGIKIPLSATRANDIASCELLIDEWTAKHVSDALVILAVQFYCNGCSQNSVHFSNPEFFQALPLKNWKKEMIIEWFISCPWHQTSFAWPMLMVLAAGSLYGENT